MLRKLAQTGSSLSARLLLLFFVPATCVSVLLAQATFGNLIGTVTDPAGAVINGAKVTITSNERGTVVNTTSNESGNYIQTHLTPGTYTLQVEAPGFQRYVVGEVVISIDRSTRVDAQLTVGQVTEQVSISAAAPALVTDRAEVSVTMQEQQVQELPLLNRNLTSLQLLLPGAQRSPWQHATSENPQGGIQINTNGQDFGSTNFMID
jgi:hypothetical protein